MDWVKAVGILVVVAMCIGALGAGLSLVDSGATNGEFAMGALSGGWVNAQGSQIAPSPLATAKKLLNSLMFESPGGVSFWVIVTGAFASLATVVVSIFLLKLAFRIWGG